MGRPRDREIVLSATERQSLMECVRSRSAPHGLVRRAHIVLASASGGSNTEIARELGISVPSVCLWRNRFLAQGLVGLYGEQRPGRPRGHDDEAVAALLTTVLQSRPASGTHWTVRGAAAATGIAKSSVQGIAKLTHAWARESDLKATAKCHAGRWTQVSSRQIRMALDRARR